MIVVVVVVVYIYDEVLIIFVGCGRWVNTAIALFCVSDEFSYTFIE